MLYICSCYYETVFEILSLIFLKKLKRSRDSDHAPLRDNLSSVDWDLLCSTHILSLRCLHLPATKKWKATPNVKILVLSDPLGDLGVTHRVHLWLYGKRVVDFLLAIIAILASSHGCGSALLSERCRNRLFLTGVGHFARKFLVDGDVARNPSMTVR